MEEFHRPHHVDPAKEKIRIALAYKNFAANQGVSHIGLGVGIDNTRRTLEDHGIWCTVWPIVNVKDLANRIEKERGNAHHHHHPPISHVFISAAWIAPIDIAKL